MTNFCDYVKQNSRNSFADLPLNEVDIACLNELAYLPLGDWLGQEQLALDKVALGQFRDYEKTLQVDLDFLITKERWNLFQAVLDSKRFEQLHLSYYTNEVSSEFERQFAAMMLEIPEIGHRQLIFRGTDDSLIGWKEDFQMTYMREIPAQRLAVTYLKHYLETTEGQLIISGHSKGGNLALYAASQQSSGQQERIQKIYLFDAPGLHQTVLSSPGYLAVRGKVVAIRPQESIVGIMLSSDIQVHIIESLKFGMEQHLMANWQVNSTGTFVKAKESTALSQALEKTFKVWTEELSSQELKIFFDTFFNLFLDNGIDSLNDFLKWDTGIAQKLGDVFKDLRTLDEAKRQLMWKSLSLLVKTFNQTSFDHQKAKFDKGEFEFSKWLKPKPEVYIKIKPKDSEDKE